MSVKDLLTRAVLFDKDKRELFLTIVSSQVKSGRPYHDIFKPMLRSKNRYYRQLAEKSLNPASEYFASQYGGLFPEHTARLLKLSQRFNAVSPFIDYSLNNPDKKSLSIFATVLAPNFMEILLSLIFSSLFVALYLYNDAIAESFVDLSSSLPYMIGGLFVSNAFPLTVLALGSSAVYIYYLNNYSPLRETLKKTGAYRFSDAKYALELFRIISIMTAGRSAEGMSIRVLFSELSAVFGTSNLRRHQFSILRREISKGTPLYLALQQSEILDHDSLELFKGLAPDESIPEISKASLAIADLLTARTKVEIRLFSKSLTFFLLLYLSLSFVAVIEVSLGGGAGILSQQTGF